MNRTPLKPGNHPEPCTWRFAQMSDGRLGVTGTCRDGHRIHLAGHNVAPDGKIGDLVRCEGEACSFAEYVTLVHWDHYRIEEVEDPVNGLREQRIVSAHNRLTDTQQVSEFISIFNRMRDIMLEEITRHDGRTPEWVPAVCGRLRLMALPWDQLCKGRFAELVLPAPDADGLVNLLAFVDANPTLFPTLTNPEHRRAFNASPLANPEIPRLV